MDRFSVEQYDDEDRMPTWDVVEWTDLGNGRRCGEVLESFYTEADAIEHLYCVKMEHSFEGSGYFNL